VHSRNGELAQGELAEAHASDAPPKRRTASPKKQSLGVSQRNDLITPATLPPPGVARSSGAYSPCDGDHELNMAAWLALCSSPYKSTPVTPQTRMRPMPLNA